MPAALSAWPMFDFTEPMAQNCLSGVCWPKAWASAAISIGSPNAVPVPCASMQLMARGSTCARASASSTSCACAFGLGTV